MDLLCANKNFIQNFEKLPLNKLFLFYHEVYRKTTKTELSVLEMLKQIEKPHYKYDSRYGLRGERKPAINKCWIQHSRRYVKFQPSYVQFDEQDNSQFLEKNEIFFECLHFFVTCTFHQFWCYIVCEPRFPDLVIHFLENAIPPCAVKYLPANCLTLYDKIYTCIYNVYQRLITFSVSETEYLEEEFAVKCLRKSNLISTPVIVNFCYLYMHSQKQFVEKLVNFSFSDIFKDVYLPELTTFCDNVSDDLDQICRRAILGTFNPSYIEETACYMCEAAGSLLTFLTVCKPAISIALQQQFPHRLPHIYQKIYLDLYDMYDMKGDIGYDWSKLDELIKQWLALGRQSFIELSHIFIEYCLNKILELRNKQREQEEYLEIYLALISTALDDEFFIRDYNEMHPVKEQFQLLIDNIPNFDKSQTEYLLQSLSAITVKVTECNSTPSDSEGAQSLLLQPFPHDLYKSIYNTLNSAEPGANQPENVIQAIKSYEELLKQWELNPNCWITDVKANIPLDGNFEDWQAFNKPSDADILQRIAAVKEMLPDLSDGFILEQLECVDYKPELVISHVLDRGTAQTSEPMVAHIGKKPQHNDARDLLDDKTDDIKKLVLKASHAYEVDDDYDDRIEIYNTFEPDKDDSKLYRHLKQNNLEYDVISDPSSSDEEGEASSDVKSKDAFCEDPAIIRARRAAQRGRVFKPPSRNADVIGKPKGQGQEENVQHNRDKKSVHKSSRANHNRKGGAQWKRSRGMMPS